MLDDATRARLEAIREQHHEAPWSYADAGPDAQRPCYGCGFPWPCDTGILLMALAAQAPIVQAAAAWAERQLYWAALEHVRAPDVALTEAECLTRDAEDVLLAAVAAARAAGEGRDG